MDQDQSESEAELPRPRLSMKIEDLDEDDSFQAPPSRRSGPSDDGIHTERSVEVPRRAYSEMSVARGSLGSIRISERFDDFMGLEEAEFTGITAAASEFSDGLINAGDEGYLYVTMIVSTVLTLVSGPSEDYDNVFDDEAGVQTAQFSDKRSRNLFEQGGDTSFAFDIPVNAVIDLPIVRTSRGQDNNANHILALSQTDNVRAPMTDRHLVVEQAPRPKSQRKPRHSTQSLSAGTVKKLAASFVRSSSTQKSKINKETLGPIMQASDWFFEQIGNDLGAYAEHAGRKTIDDTDVIMLMKRPVLNLFLT